MAEEFKERKRRALEFLGSVSRFKITEVENFECDDERGEDYYSYPFDDKTIAQDLQWLIYDCFKVLQEKKSDEKIIQDLRISLKASEERYRALESKIQILKGSL